MTTLFLKLVNMSLSAGWLVLAVVLLRLLLKDAPKALRCVLWALVAVRLLLPFSIESSLSLVPSAQPIPVQDVLSGPGFNIQTGIPVVDAPVNDYLDDRYLEGVTVATGNGQRVTSVLAVTWLLGMTAMALYTAFSYRRLRQKVAASVVKEGNIWLCDYIDTPFILGVVRPRIYLPSAMEEGQAAHVIAHEKAHLSRRDHWWKPLGFTLLTIYWFNPLMWVAYILLCRDIELACDEKVIRNLGGAEKKNYSEALLQCSVPRRMIAACPLAFGEVGVKARIRSVLHYKKPAFWLVVAAVAACIAAAVCFLTNPAGDYTARIRWMGQVYEDSGRTVTDLPQSATELGMLESILHWNREIPEQDLQATNLDAKYAGCPVYYSNNALYVQDYGGFYLYFQGGERVTAVTEEEILWRFSLLPVKRGSQVQQVFVLDESAGDFLGALLYQDSNGVLQWGFLPQSGCETVPFSDEHTKTPIPGTKITYLGATEFKYYLQDQQGTYWETIITIDDDFSHTVHYHCKTVKPWQIPYTDDRAAFPAPTPQLMAELVETMRQAHLQNIPKAPAFRDMTAYNAAKEQLLFYGDYALDYAVARFLAGPESNTEADVLWDVLEGLDIYVLWEGTRGPKDGWQNFNAWCTDILCFYQRYGIVRSPILIERYYDAAVERMLDNWFLELRFAYLQQAASSTLGDAQSQTYQSIKRALISWGDHTLRYTFQQFLSGSPEAILAGCMWDVTAELLGMEAALESPYADGQTAFDEWKDYIVRLHQRNGDSFIIENYPKGWILIQMIENAG